MDIGKISKKLKISKNMLTKDENQESGALFLNQNRSYEKTTLPLEWLFSRFF